MLAGGMVALTATDLLIADPGDTEDDLAAALGESDGGSIGHGAGDGPHDLAAMYAELGWVDGFGPLAPDADPLAADDAGDGDGDAMMNSLSSSTVFASVTKTRDIHEWSSSSCGGPSPYGAFRFAASNCVLSSTSTTVTIHYTVGGTADGPDPNGDFTSGGSPSLNGSIDVTIPANEHSAWRYVNVTAVDDTLDEPTETIEVAISENANYNIAFTQGVAIMQLQSGDHTFHNVFEGKEGGGHAEALKEIDTTLPTWVTAVDTVDGGDWPHSTLNIGIQLYQNGDRDPLPNKEIRLSRLNSRGGGDLVFVNANGQEVNELTVTTGNDGVAYFNIRGKTKGLMDLAGTFTNAEDKPQSCIIEVRIYENGP